MDAVREELMQKLMERVEVTVKTQLNSQLWRERILGWRRKHPAGVENLDEELCRIEAGTLDLLANDIAANFVGGLVDACPVCGCEEGLMLNDHFDHQRDPITAAQRLRDAAVYYAEHPEDSDRYALLNERACEYAHAKLAAGETL
jgi:hypothetical protein